MRGLHRGSVAVVVVRGAAVVAGRADAVGVAEAHAAGVLGLAAQARVWSIGFFVLGSVWLSVSIVSPVSSTLIGRSVDSSARNLGPAVVGHTKTKSIRYESTG